MKDSQLAGPSERAFCFLGHCIAWCQVLEHQIAVILSSFEISEGHVPQGTDVVAYYKDAMSLRVKKTLGQLLRDPTLPTLTPNAGDVLEEALQARNWLAHHSIREPYELLFSRDGETELLAQMQTAMQKITKAIEMLDPVMDVLFDRLGYDQERRRKDRMKDFRKMQAGWVGKLNDGND